MKKTLLMVAISLFVVAIFVSVGFTHIISIESQTLYKIPWHAPEDEDFSFENPFIVTRIVQDPYGNDLFVSPQESQAIFAYLTQDDFDVYEVFVEAPGLISASALPPACQQTRKNYPYTALLYPLPPGSLPSAPGMELPFEIPADYGIIIAENPEVGKKEQRAIFDIDLADPELALGISWFLPLGLDQDCLFDVPPTCDFSNTISEFVAFPGTYYIVIWDPDGKQQDYTANIGFLEVVSELIDQTDMQEMVEDNALLHRPCKEPYPWAK